MPCFYYISFEFTGKRLAIKDFTNIKPLRDPHFSFDLCEIEFMLSGHWDMWVDYTIKDGRLIRVRKEINCNIAQEKEFPELYILLTEFCAPSEPDDVLLPKIYDMEKSYWDSR